MNNAIKVKQIMLNWVLAVCHRFGVLCFYLYFITATAFYGLICLAVFLFLSSNQRYAMIRFFCKGFVYACKTMCGIDYAINPTGMKTLMSAHQAKNHRTFIISKHQSTWETMAFIALFPQRLSFVLKRELLFIPIFGWVLSMLEMLQIDRKKGSRAFAFLSQHMHAKIAKGITPLMFPEGTRTLPGAQVQYKSGAARLALKNECSIILVAHNAGIFYPKNGYLKHRGCIQIEIMPAFSASKYHSIDALNQYMAQQIEDKQALLNHH